jgi:hypothetical protein
MQPWIAEVAAALTEDAVGGAEVVVDGVADALEVALEVVLDVAGEAEAEPAVSEPPRIRNTRKAAAAMARTATLPSTIGMADRSGALCLPTSKTPFGGRLYRA